MEILEVKDLSFKYPKCDKNILNEISFSIKKGEINVLCGATGSGKSTLLRMLKRELEPLGEKKGELLFNGVPLDSLDERSAVSKIGFVMQKPEQQIVTDKVWHELAFGLENLNVPESDISRRVAEMASYFGIGPWYDKSVSVLSGGQKQLLNLAAVLVMQPELLILDEPTAQLDPIAAADFIATLKRLNQDFGLTIIIAEHRLEELVPICDKLLVMDNGKLIANDSPKKVIRQLKNRSDFLICMPSAARIYAELSDDDDCPLTVRDGGYFIRANFLNDISNIDTAEKNTSTENALEFKDVYFRYEKNGRDILNGLDMTVKMGEVYCILGGNGSGKTTTLNVSSGLAKAYSGNVRIFGKKIKDYKNRSLYNKCLAMLPQDVQTVFLRNTVREEFEDSGTDISKLPFEAAHLLDKHPYDLSGGEQQLVALAKILAAEPKLLLLDEPTKGLDASAKKKIIEVIKSLSEGGMTIVIVTHDVEFAALCSDRCAMFFNGKIVSSGSPGKFFSENNFYTTAASRMTRGYYENAVTVESVIELCRKNGKRGANYDSN